MTAVVVGGGIVGLTVAWAFARRGRRVILIEQSELPNRLNASFDQHRLIHGFERPPAAVPTIGGAFAAWGALWRDLGCAAYAETGAVRIYADAQAAKFATERLAAEGVDCRLLDRRALREVLPGIDPGPEAAAAFAPRAGVLFADRLAARLVDWLTASRVELRSRRAVSSLDLQQGVAILDDGERVRGDPLVVAAGAWTSHILPSLRPRVGARRQILSYFQPPAALAESWRTSPVFLGAGGDRHLWGAPPVGGTDLKLAAGCLARPGDPAEDADRATGSRDVEALTAAFRKCLGDLSGYRLLRTEACFYCTVEGGTPICAPLDAGKRLWVIAGGDGSDYKFAAANALSFAEAVS